MYLSILALIVAIYAVLAIQQLSKKTAKIADAAAKGLDATNIEVLRIRRSLSKSQAEIYTNLVCEKCGDLLPVGSVRTHAGRWLCPKHKAA